METYAAIGICFHALLVYPERDEGERSIEQKILQAQLASLYSLNPNLLRVQLHYFHYHIKASKVSILPSYFCHLTLLGVAPMIHSSLVSPGTLADFIQQAYIHTRMRKRTADFLQGMCLARYISASFNADQY